MECCAGRGQGDARGEGNGDVSRRINSECVIKVQIVDEVEIEI